jgi:hypothetical protein
MGKEELAVVREEKFAGVGRTSLPAARCMRANGAWGRRSSPVWGREDELAGVGKDKLAGGQMRGGNDAWGRTSLPAVRCVRANGTREMN